VWEKLQMLRREFDGYKGMDPSLINLRKDRERLNLAADEGAFSIVKRVMIGNLILC
jgi:hypothetical protein